MLRILKNLLAGGPAERPTEQARPPKTTGVRIGSAVPIEAPEPVAFTSIEASMEAAQPVPAPVAVREAVAVAPQLPSQFEEGEALRASAQWKQCVQEGISAWDQKMQLLMERIQALQQGEGSLGTVVLMMLAAYYYLDFSSGQLLEPKFAQALRLRIERDLEVGSYKKYIEEKTRTRWNSYPRSVDFYVEEFLSLRSCFLDGFIRMIDTLPQMMDLVDGLYDQIKQAEAKLMPGRGGDHMLRFRGFMAHFAQEHLPGITPKDFFPEPVPRYTRDRYADNIKTSGYLLLWALSGVVKTFLRERTTSSTSQAGIEFEQRLIREISGTFPGAQIETTPVTGDQGADVVFRLDGIKIVIQAKRYTGVVGNAAVQEVFAAQQFYEADYAMVVTTSRYTAPAQVLAQKIGVELTTADDYLRRIQQLLV